jgi:hypothetical protein
MAARIEILDYSYSVNTIGSQMLGNSSFNDTSCWSLTGGWSIAGGKATHSGSLGHLDNVCLSNSFELGASYRVTYKISGHTQGNLGIKFRGASCSNLATPSTNGTHTFDFTQQNCGLSSFGIFAYGNFNGSIEYIEVYRLSGIDWDKSIVGELEITDHSDFPLALTFQIGDVKDITSTSGDYSKTFKVPATKSNNKLLKHIYNPKIVLENNPAKYKPCRIVIDGIQTIIGLLKVTGMGGRVETPSYYDCVFYSNNMSWGKSLEESYLNEPDLFPNSTGLTYNKESIVATWQHEDSDVTSPIVYPVTSYGDFNPDGNDYTVQLLDTLYGYDTSSANIGKTGYFGWDDAGSDYGTPHPVADWRPAIFVKTTLERIFNSLGYNISSQFMETDIFKGLVWLLPNFQYNNPDDRYNDLGIEAVWTNLSTLNTPSTTYLRQNEVDTYYTGSGTSEIDIGTTENLTVTLDSGSYFDMAANEITVGEYGNYDIRLGGVQARAARVYHDSASFKTFNNMSCTINIEVKTVGQTSWNIIEQAELDMRPTRQGYPSGTKTTNREEALFTNFANIGNIDAKGRWLNKGDRIRLTGGIRVNATDDPAAQFKVYVNWKATSGSYLQISIDPLDVYWGQTYDLDKVIDAKHKQIDFIKGVAHAFNLVMTTDSQSKTVYIEPFNDFYKTLSNAVDWTSKLDRSREISDKWMPSELKRKFIFKYKTDDKDAKVKHRGKVFFDGVEDEYPYQEDLSDKFDKGESIFENPFFAGTYNAADRDTNNHGVAVKSSCLWQDKGDGLQTSSNDWARPDKGYDFLPRLLYWNKLENFDQSPSLLNYMASVQTWASTIDYVTANENDAYVLSQVYPQATSINRNNALSPVLSYGNVWTRHYYPTSDTYSDYEIGKGLYETYYRGLLEMLKESPRLRTVYVDLKTKDIVSLDFMKLIYIDGCYWRISKVMDYKPNSNTPTKVELIEWVEAGVHALHPPNYGSSGGTGNWGTPMSEGAFDWLHNVEE